MPIAYNPTQLDGRTVAESNDLKVLKAVRVFGHLRRQEIAMAVWPKSSGKSAYIMAWRTTARLLKNGLLLERLNTLGERSYILATKGVTRLKDAGLDAQEGYELAYDGPQFFHRTLGTSYLLEKARQGSTVFGEYAILKGWAPVSRDYARTELKKVPDGLIIYDGSHLGLRAGLNSADWIEVESAYKAHEDLMSAFMLFVNASNLNAEASVFLHKLVFVYDSRQNHEKHIMASLKRAMVDHPTLRQDSVLSEIVLAKCFIDPPLIWRGVEERTALDLLKQK